MDEQDYKKHEAIETEEGEDDGAADAAATASKMLGDTAVAVGAAAAAAIAAGEKGIAKEVGAVAGAAAAAAIRAAAEAGTTKEVGSAVGSAAAAAAAAVKEGVDASGKEQRDGGRLSDLLRSGEQIRTAEASELIRTLERGEKKISPEAFLSRTERMLLNDVHSAFKSGDLSSVQESLAAIAENPNSVKAVMNALKARLESNGNSVRWETGTDSNGQAFVRLHINQVNGKGGASTNVMVGSDGTHSASHNGGRFNRENVAMDPAAALREVSGANYRQWIQDNGFKPIIIDDLRRHGSSIKPTESTKPSDNSKPYIKPVVEIKK